MKYIIGILLALIAVNAIGQTCAIQYRKDGRIKRSATAIRKFKAMGPCPYDPLSQGCIVDHVVPLCAGGCDSPDNMQWQTRKEAALKDVIEKKECAEIRKKASAR